MEHVSINYQNILSNLYPLIYKLKPARLVHKPSINYMEKKLYAFV
jgi:hypothetical protein